MDKMCWKAAPKDSVLFLWQQPCCGNLLARTFLHLQMEAAGEALTDWRSTGINCWGTQNLQGQAGLLSGVTQVEPDLP